MFQLIYFHFPTSYFPNAESIRCKLDENALFAILPRVRYLSHIFNKFCVEEEICSCVTKVPNSGMIMKCWCKTTYGLIWNYGSIGRLRLSTPCIPACPFRARRGRRAWSSWGWGGRWSGSCRGAPCSGCGSSCLCSSHWIRRGSSPTVGANESRERRVLSIHYKHKPLIK